jgi:hypothetical protein
MPRVIVASGFVAKYPHGGGVFSFVLQYVLGLRRLGCEVCWLELLWPQGADDHALIRTFIKRLAEFGLEHEFCLMYFPQGEWPDAGPQRECYGMAQKEFDDYCRTTDLLLDLCASVRLPDLLAAVRRTAFIDLDPGFMQIWIHQGALGSLPHDLFFTVGQNIGHPSCPVPVGKTCWRTFWPLVDLDLWRYTEGNSRAPFSTVSQWWGYPPVIYNEEEYDGAKRTEFLRFIDLPILTRHPFELALNIGPEEIADRELLRKKNWNILDPYVVAGDFATYQQYVRRSCGEFSVAKPGYVKSRSGWFSDRTACYLAAGRPVLVQDTGVSAYLPTGHGVLTFSSLEEAVVGVEEIRRNYRLHSQAAREMAQEYFAAEKVLTKLIDEI